MDVAYNQHSHHSRRNDRSSTNLSGLSLAPLTSRLPLNDQDDLPEAQQRPSFEHRSSYIEGRSAPSTPRILSRSSSRVSLRKPLRDGLAKSKSSTHIQGPHHQHSKSSPAVTNGRQRRALNDLTLSALPTNERRDSDWLLRAGALLSTGALESKGQTWLVSRASSTSLTGQRDEEDEELERELARERDSRRSSRRGSANGVFMDADDEFSPVTTRFGQSSRSGSRVGSRPGSRRQSRRGSRSNMYTPLAMTEKDRDGYFDPGEEFVAEPDFVDVDDDVYDEQQALEDEKAVRRLAKNGTIGLGSWVEQIMGWSLFTVEDDGEDSDNETTEPQAVYSSAKDVPTQQSGYSRLSEGTEKSLPPPSAEEGGWRDAAWLFSVATKVLL